MPTYSNEFKDGILRKMMATKSQNIEQICNEVGLSQSILYDFKQSYQFKGHLC